MIREKFQKAVEIITKNDRGGYTVPTYLNFTNN